MKSKVETRGRKALPLDKKKAPQATVKINDVILPFVRLLKGNLKKGILSTNTLYQLFSVLKGEQEQQASVFNDPEAISIVAELQEKIHMLEAEKLIAEGKLAFQQEISLKHVQERDKALLNVTYTESKLNSLKSSYRLLRLDYDNLLDRDYDCMAIKANGERCTKKSVTDAIYHGINLHVCLQHAKSLAKKLAL